MSTRDQPVLWLNSRKGSGGSLTAGGGNVLLKTPQHKLDGPEHLAADDTTTLDTSTTAHGLAPKLPGDATKYLDGTGAYSVPPGTAPTTHYEPIFDGQGTATLNGLGDPIVHLVPN